MEMATYLPQNLDELSGISGFGEVKLRKYGDEFLSVVVAHCSKYRLGSRINLKAAKRQRNGKLEHDNNTKQQSLSLFRNGKSIEDIAALRKLSPGTVEGHLAFYVEQGKLAVEELVDVEKIPLIREAIEQVGGKMLTPIMMFLGDDFTYGEIKYVMADMEGSKVEEAFTDPYRVTTNRLLLQEA
jgi:ATP-dependent DNA helicase RecQ